MQNCSAKRGSFTLFVDDLRVRAGKIVCVVGPNGGGKTTLLLTALGLLPHKGLCAINGSPFDGTDVQVKSRIGFIPDDPQLMLEELTAAEQWSVTAGAFASVPLGTDKALNLRRAQALAEQLSFIPPPAPAMQYSHGMHKKTQVVNALLAHPDLLVVDELRNGLDPIAIKQAEDLMVRERRSGTAILAATHDLWWAERFADYVYIVNDGKIITGGTLKQLLARGEAHLEDAFFRIIREHA